MSMRRVSEITSASIGSTLTNINTWVGITFVIADRTGTFPSSAAINKAIQNANLGDEIHFLSGTYLIDSPIQWNKKVTLVANGRVVLKAVNTMDSVIKCTAFTAYSDVHVNGFYIDANDKADHCIKLDGSVSGYITRTNIDNCECRNAVLDGIRIVAPAWVIGINNTLSNENGRDGLRAIVPTSTGSEQINHITVDENCIFNDNVEAGINIMGVNHMIGAVDIEGNNDGIKIDMSQNTGNYIAWDITIKGPYVEGNKRSQFYIKAVNGDQIRTSISNCYINSFYSGAGAGDTLILCSGPSEGISLELPVNYYSLSGGIVTKILDGGNALSSRGLISEGIYLNEGKFVNLGIARVLWDYYKNIQLPATTCFGVTAKSVFETENILLLTTKSIIYPVMVDLTQSLIQAIFASIKSDCSAFNITAYVIEVDVATGSSTKTTSFTITGSNNQDWGAFVVNNWGYYRIPYGRELTIRFDVNSYSGTTLTIKCPYLKVI